ncbi:unnamed protein product [Paramecium pentaurelia]|uniref:Uncharacterized protein n=1 Tax=Paramecium pentaurelia TaxID=43138 RepID=A0A8S1VV01_9CILI|nr:unnamed protein product [Paramecium pentaurelia]
MTKQLNILDKQSILIAISIVLACSIHSGQQQNLNEITWPFYVTIVSIILAYFNRIFDKIDRIKKKLFIYLPLNFVLNLKFRKPLKQVKVNFQEFKKDFEFQKNIYQLQLGKILKLESLSKNNNNNEKIVISYII